MNKKEFELLKCEFELINMSIGINANQGDCHENSEKLAQRLKDLGYDIKLCTGFYVNWPKVIKHSWIEYKDKYIFETDCRQLREQEDIMPDKYAAFLEKDKFKHRYKFKSFVSF